MMLNVKTPTRLLYGVLLCITLCTSLTLIQQKAIQSNERQPVTDELVANLTSDSWVKTLGSAQQPEHYVYSFSKDGTYTSKIISDVNPDLGKGKWRVTTDKQGKVHLVLKHDHERYYWLQQDSIITYAKAKDVMLISGENYDGVQQLHRKKAEPQAD